MSTITDSTTLSGNWDLDVAHSTIGFAVKHMVVSTFRGRFERYRAAVETVDGRPRLVGTVDADSIEVKNPDLAAHLLAPDFFDAERHPQLRFASTRIALDGDRIEVEGDLTIRGVTRPVTLAVEVDGAGEDPYGGYRLSLLGRGEIDRFDYGIPFNAKTPNGALVAGEKVRLVLTVEAVKEA